MIARMIGPSAKPNISFARGGVSCFPDEQASICQQSKAIQYDGCVGCDAKDAISAALAMGDRISHQFIDRHGRDVMHGVSDNSELCARIPADDDV
jgi:hypothetical protein